MKHQYYGDRRDHIKLFVWDGLSRALGLRRTTYVPMLTPDDDVRNRRVHAQPNDPFPESVRGHFEKTVNEPGATGFSHWFRRNYFAYRDGGADDDFFVDVERFAYFSAIPVEHLQGALVFLDPDTGTRGRARVAAQGDASGFVYVDEVVSLWSRMQSSALLVYQHLQQDAHKRVADLVKAGVRLRDSLGKCQVVFFLERDVGFLFLIEDALVGVTRVEFNRVVAMLRGAPSSGECSWGIVT